MIWVVARCSAVPLVTLSQLLHFLNLAASLRRALKGVIGHGHLYLLIMSFVNTPLYLSNSQSLFSFLFHLTKIISYRNFLIHLLLLWFLSKHSSYCIMISSGIKTRFKGSSAASAVSHAACSSKHQGTMRKNYPYLLLGGWINES